jgi:hypothetical protein
MSEWLEVLKTFGFPVALCIFFVWQGTRFIEQLQKENRERESQLSEKLASVENFVKLELVQLVRSSAEAISSSNAFKEHMLASLEENTTILRELLNKIMSKT